MRYAVLALLAGCAFDPGGAAIGDDDTTISPVDAGSLPATGDAAITPDPPDAGADAMPPAPTLDASVACGPGYTPNILTGSAYRVVSQSERWEDAEEICEEDGAGAHLVVIDDALELGVVNQLSYLSDLWIGMTDLVDEDVWLTVTGADGFQFGWDPGEPNDSGGQEDCAELVGAVLNDENCATHNAFVCECDQQTVNHEAF